MKFQTVLTVFVLFALFVISLNFVSAVVVSEVKQSQLLPGDQTNVQITLKNNLNDDVQDVSFNLVFTGTQFISIGSSEGSTDEIRSDKSKTFFFNIKSAQDIKPGNYNIPYTIVYTDIDDKVIQRQGSIGIVVSGKTDLDFSVETEKPVIGESGKLTLKIVNSGFGDLKFVNVKLQPQGFILLGSDSDYIGTINSDDFETATFDVIFKEENARLVASVDFKDFDNNQQTRNIDLPITVYSKEKAIELGIIQKNNTWMYSIVVIVIVLIWFIYRAIRKRTKKRNQFKEA